MKKVFSIAMLAVFLALLAAPAALAVSGPGYNLTPSLTTLAHGASGTLTVTLTIPANTVGSSSVYFTTSSDLTFAGVSAGLNVSMPQGQDSLFSLAWDYTMKNTAQVPQQINWIVDTVFNGESSHYSGSFTINVEHVYGAPAAVPPTCVEQGYTETVCGICGFANRTDYVPATGHNWGYWVHDAATSGMAATHTRTCLNDPAHTETENCDFIINGPISPPYCTTDGAYWNLCKYCGYSYINEVIPAYGHAWGAWAHDGATSGASSNHTRVCANDASHTETVPCVFTSAVTAPTCTEAGYTTHTCGECGYSYTDSLISPPGHAWGAWAHDAATSGAASTHTKVCANDPAHTETEPCVFTPVVTAPTCTEAGFTTHACGMCGYSYTDSPVDALGHSPGEWEVVTPATGYAEGERVRHCTRCGVELDREAIPKLDGRRFNNTACAIGQRLRDADPALTNLWYMYAPVDLGADGVQTFPLIAANLHYIGDAQVTVQGGSVKVGYKLNTKAITVKGEFLAFYPDFETAAAAVPELTAAGLPLGTDIAVADALGDSAKGLMLFRLVIDYDIYADGLEYYRPGMFD